MGLKPGHDGSVAFIEDGTLVFSIEGEKDSFPRNSKVTVPLLLQAMEMAPASPDVIAMGGWGKYLPGLATNLGAGYFGVTPGAGRDGRFFGQRVTLFSSSHERSHLYVAASMAPNAPLEECVILVWEGAIGALYHWQAYGELITKQHVLTEPGARYAALFALADRAFPDLGSEPRLEDAGKLMALAAYSDDEEPTDEAITTVEALLAQATFFPAFHKQCYRHSPLYNCNVDDPLFHRAARYLTDRLFEIFRDVAEREMPRRLPLLISGGCGLNCEWNTRWREGDFFTSVFVPPCTNDAGSAIGTAVDAACFSGEPCSLRWSVYSGAPFCEDTVPNTETWSAQPLDFHALADALMTGRVVAWVQGRYEIGPRALGHRSLLASPLSCVSRQLLNEIKERQPYRPIAPCCAVEELGRWFEDTSEDPYMLYLTKLKTDKLPAITHVDGSARVQSVNAEQQPRLYSLLEAFRGISGYGVLCNTSLNFRGHGFLNSMSELTAYCEMKGISDFVVGDAWYRWSTSVDGRA
jgi:hydroxymethyl cephem carbamoyltransferase